MTAQQAPPMLLDRTPVRYHLNSRSHAASSPWLILPLTLVLVLSGCRRHPVPTGAEPASTPTTQTPPAHAAAAQARTPAPHAHPNTATEISKLNNLPTILVHLKGDVFKLWVAKTNAQQERGLMFIRAMPANRGMLFAFPYSQDENFWMKNTLIPLDLIYLDRTGRINQFETMPAWDGSPHYYPSLSRVRYAIELNAGVARRLGLSVGYRILLPKSVSAGAAAQNQ